MQRVEDLALEGLARRIDGVSGNLTGADPVSEPVDGDPARLHDRGVAVFIDRGPQSGEVEETMDRGDAPIVGCHNRHSSGDRETEHPTGWRHGWS
jgi:hypothetical protein